MVDGFQGCFHSLKVRFTGLNRSLEFFLTNNDNTIAISKPNSFKRSKLIPIFNTPSIINIMFFYQATQIFYAVIINTSTNCIFKNINIRFILKLYFFNFSSHFLSLLLKSIDNKAKIEVM